MVVLFFFFFFFFDGESFVEALLLFLGGSRTRKWPTLKRNRQYSDCRLHMCSTQAVNSKDTVVNSLCVKYKSSRGVVDKGMWVSAV